MHWCTTRWMTPGRRNPLAGSPRRHAPMGSVFEGVSSSSENPGASAVFADVDFCGGRQKDVLESINAYSDMEKYYRPLVDEGNFDTQAGLVACPSFQKPGVKEAVTRPDYPDGLRRAGFTNRSSSFVYRPVAASHPSNPKPARSLSKKDGKEGDGGAGTPRSRQGAGRGKHRSTVRRALSRGHLRAPSPIACSRPVTPSGSRSGSCANSDPGSLRSFSASVHGARRCPAEGLRQLIDVCLDQRLVEIGRSSASIAFFASFLIKISRAFGIGKDAMQRPDGIQRIELLFVNPARKSVRVNPAFVTASLTPVSGARRSH